MQSFQVLDRNQSIRQNYLLEASAGTGKTFSIENIVVRLLVEGDLITIDQILVVTFTRAATRDLRSRIHKNILAAIHILKELKNGCRDNAFSKYDYLIKIAEEGDEMISQALRQLERALSSFDLAQIYTIHGFCSRMLSEHTFECNFNLTSGQDDSSEVGAEVLKRAVRDFIRGGFLSKRYSRAQKCVLMETYSGDLDKLEDRILDQISKGIEIEKPLPDYPELFSNFQKSMNTLKHEYGFTKEKILEDFLALAPLYKNNCDIKRRFKPEVIARAEKFADLFEKDVWEEDDLEWLIRDQLSILLSFAEPNNQKGVDRNPSLHYSTLPDLIKTHLLSLVNVNAILASVTSDCQKLIEKFKEREEVYSFDDYLKCMNRAIENPVFRSAVAGRYKAAIIDEFQDTDPLQWEIFEKLFLQDAPGNCLLYLVGDPKQSIYAFRQADIYTYLAAGDRLGRQSHFSLDTNYRSDPRLTDALNAVFQESSSPGLLYLPKRNESMPYPLVKSPGDATNRQFSDEKGALHFFIVESQAKSKLDQNCIFPFMASEIKSLVECDQFALKDIAILVEKHSDAAKVTDYLEALNIPVAKQRAESLADSPIFTAMRQLIAAVVHPKDLSLLKIALGGRILCWTDDQVKRLEETELLEEVLYTFYALRDELTQNGFASFYQKLLKIRWKAGSHSVMENILLQKSGEMRFQQLQQVADLLLERGVRNLSNPDALIKYLDEVKSRSANDHEIARAVSDPSRDAVQIMTLHASKGLEFGVVFAPGLARVTNPKKRFVQLQKEGRRLIVPLLDEKSKDYREFCEEEDCEKIRKLYVAMTRAKHRLYVPAEFHGKKTKSTSSATPMQLFLARFGQAPIEQSHIYERIGELSKDSFIKEIEKLQSSHSISYTLLDEGSFHPEPLRQAEDVVLREPPAVNIPGNERYLNSFTTLSAATGNHARSSLMEAPRNFDAEMKTVHTLPAGSATGNLLHQLLESLDFELCSSISSEEELGPFVRPYVENTLFEPWEKVLCEILFHAVKTPLSAGFSLSEVATKYCVKEEEFLYESFRPHPPGLIKGFIDLFFFHQGKYYLLDWKSNWLGPSSAFYTRSEMQTAMKESDYLLQAALYGRALKKYLKIVDDRPFRDIFGGVYYIFLRGMPSGGVFDLKIED